MKNYWKYIVMFLLGSVAIFHLVVVWYVSDESYELTSSDYYAREMKYSEEMDRKKAAKAFVWDVAIKNDQFQLKVSDQNGTTPQLEELRLGLYRPNNASLDQNLSLALQEDGSYMATFAKLEKGLWRLSVDGQHQGVPLTYEERVHIQ